MAGSEPLDLRDHNCAASGQTKMATLAQHEGTSNDIYHFHDVSADSVLQPKDSLAWFKLEKEIDSSIDGFESEIASQLSSLITKVKVTSEFRPDADGENDSESYDWIKGCKTKGATYFCLE